MGIRPLSGAVFLDRDGVINRITVANGVPHPPRMLSAFVFIPQVAAACRRLERAGLKLVVVTNQPDIARGTQTRHRVAAMNARVSARLPVEGVLTCFHDGPDACLCRKPKPGLLRQAATRWRLDLKRSFMVGDRWSDVVAGHAAGCRSILIKKSYSQAGRCRPDWMARDLTEAAEIILKAIKHEIKKPAR
jgi:D-glycero-D-manno-heptose 1,7-bisphosphate phosphatase